MILSACSSYFEQLFINFNEPHQVVILKDTSFADIVAIVEFMYKGEINVSQVRGDGREPSGNLKLAKYKFCYCAEVPAHMVTTTMSILCTLYILMMMMSRRIWPTLVCTW